MSRFILTLRYMNMCHRSISFKSSALTSAIAGSCFVLSIRLREPGWFLSVFLSYLRTSADPVSLQPKLIPLSSSALLPPSTASGKSGVWFLSLLLPCIHTSALLIHLYLRENHSVHLPCLQTFLVKAYGKELWVNVISLCV